MVYYSNANAGYKKMFYGYICSLISAIASILYTAVPSLEFLSYFTSILVLVSLVLIVLGLFQAGKDIKGCKTALITFVVFWFIQTFVSLLANEVYFNTVGFVMYMVMYYFVCTSSIVPLQRVNEEKTAKLASFTWIATGILYAVLIVLTFISAKVPNLAAIIQLIEVLPAAIYTFYLYKCAKGFNLLV